MTEDVYEFWNCLTREAQNVTPEEPMIFIPSFIHMARQLRDDPSEHEQDIQSLITNDMFIKNRQIGYITFKPPWQYEKVKVTNCCHTVFLINNCVYDFLVCINGRSIDEYLKALSKGAQIKEYLLSNYNSSLEALKK